MHVWLPIFWKNRFLLSSLMPIIYYSKDLLRGHSYNANSCLFLLAVSRHQTEAQMKLYVDPTHWIIGRLLVVCLCVFGI